jgi:hypothetical protein
MPAVEKLNFIVKRNKRKTVVLLIVFAIIFIPTCISKKESRTEDERGQQYAGPAECKNCHQDIYKSEAHTAHFNTSNNQLPLSVQEAFERGKNVFKFNDSIEVVMEKTGAVFYQSFYQNGKKKFSYPIDIVVGSGRKAQTYLYYTDKGKISQLPVSYFISLSAWANSPGFPPDHPKFDRNIPSNCLGCHSSFVAVKQTYKGVAMEEQFEKNKIIYGIDCERCHGPALSHVEYHKDHPEDKDAKFITKISKLGRVQKNDMCALCHSGFRNVQQSLFNFKPGDNIDNFYVPEYGRADTTNLDVHGNQIQLMMASQCYSLTNNLTCVSCHDVHVKERDNTAVFSGRCMTCHKQVNHSFTSSMNKNLNAIIQGDCIDCHMPLKASNLITMMTKAKLDAYPDYIRTHRIAVYQEETKKFLDSLNHRPVNK